MGDVKVMALVINGDNIPLSLRQSKQWIVWNLEGKTETFKGTKVPYQVKNPYLKASTTEEKNWAHFGEAAATAALHDMSGVGYVFTAEQGVVAIDIDGCVDPDGSISSPAKEAIELFRDKTYIEKSHSGKGFHILVKGDMPTSRLKNIEVYNYGRYFAMTGDLVGACTEINKLDGELNKLYTLYTDSSKEWINPNWDKQKPTGQSLSLVDELNLRVEDIGYPGNAKEMGNGEIRGSHPFHGSTTGGNYAINKQKNVWICRRDGHNSGGGPLELFAVKEGIIQCEEARSGCLEGKWRDIFKSLKSAGYKIPEKEKPPQKVEQTKPILPSDIHCTDFGNALRFLNRYSTEVLYCNVQDSWYIWNDETGIWKKDATLTIREYVKDIFREIYHEAEYQSTPEARGRVAKWAIQCEKPDHINACLNVAQSDGKIVVHPNKFDTDKYLFNLQNGIYDLRTHEFLPHDKQNYITKLAEYKYDPEATCPKFLKFIDRIFKSRKDKIEIINYLQKALGYSLTGEVSQQAIFLLYGSGANGKSTLIETQRMVMGGYGTTIDSSSLITKKNDSVRNDIARLPSIRFVAASENSKGTILDEELVKKLSGGDQITARFLFQEEFQFYPQLKLWWAFNHPPGLRDFTHSLMRRLKLIPFEEVISVEECIDQSIILNWHREELPGIFNWELEGLKKFQKEGLKDIQAVKTAVKEFKEEQDRLHEFIIDECFIPGTNGIAMQDVQTSASLLGARFNEWAERNNEKIMSQRKFSMELKERGLKKIHTMTGTVFCGIGLK
jgi:putative DNA primase/helicase